MAGSRQCLCQLQTYDAEDWQTENAVCKLQWFYDRAGNNTREHQYLRYLQEPHVAIWKHEYDALNQRIATTRPDGHRVSWLTCGSGHLLALKVDDQELLSYQRDNLHREIARDQGNGLQQRQAWTPNGQLLEHALGKRGDPQRLVVSNYRHDAAGQLTRIDDNRLTVAVFIAHKQKRRSSLIGVFVKYGAGNETCTRTVSRCFPNTFFVGLASEDLNCSLVFRPRQQIRPKSSTDVQRAALSTPDPRSVHRRRRLPRTHHPRPVVCPASIIVKTIRQMVLVMAQVGCWERLHHNSQGPSAQAPLKERARWPPRFRTRFFVDISG